MLMKRMFATDAHARGEPVCTHVEVKHTGHGARQNFSHRLVGQAVAQGWMTIDGDALTIKTDAEPLVYELLRVPGYYCASTGERIPISDIAWSQRPRGELSSREAKAWLAAHGKPLTDYEVTDAYECELADEQHAKFRAVVGPKGQITAAHKQEG